MATTAQIIPFPSRSDRLHRSDELVEKWGRIQKIKDLEERTIAMFQWREEMKTHLSNRRH